MSDTISRRMSIDAVEFGITYAKAIDKSTGEVKELFKEGNKALNEAVERLKELPSAEPERLTDDDFETIRIHLNAQKEKLCNQQRWEEAEEYQRIIDRFMAFASAQPERKRGKWLREIGAYLGGYPRFRYHCSVCGNIEEHVYADSKCANFCPNCGADMRGEQNG